MSKSFEIPNNPESKESNENPYNLNRYWKRYNFPGNPPRPGTVAEQRVIDASIAYVKIAEECAINNNQTVSDARRRSCHDALALLIFGKTRTDLNLTMANKLGDFAAYLITGQSLQSTTAEAAERDKMKQYL